MTRHDTTTPTAERLQRLLVESPAAAQQLQETSTDALLTTYAALTHRLHGARPMPVAADLLSQRDMVRAEILRRSGDL